MGDLERFAVFFVFISNGLMIVAVMYAGYRLWLTAEQTRLTMTEASADLIAAGRGLRGLDVGVERMIERLASAEKQAAAMAQVATETVTGLDTQLVDHVRAMLDDLVQRGGLGDEKLHNDVRKLLDSMTGLEPARFSDWEQLHREELEQVMAQRSVLSAENDQMRERMEDLQRRINALKADRKDARDDSEKVQSLRSNLDQQRQLSARHRERALEAEQRAAAAEARINQLATEMQRLDGEAQRRQAEASQVLDDVQRELVQARTERYRARQELDRTNESMSRMAIEKDFIEDKFLGLDESAEARSAAAP